MPWRMLSLRAKRGNLGGVGALVTERDCHVAALLAMTERETLAMTKGETLAMPKRGTLVMTKQGVVRGDASNAVIGSEARQSRRGRGVGYGTGLPRRCAPRNDRKSNARDDEERNTGDDEVGGYSRRRVGCCHCERSAAISLPEGEGRGGTAHGFEIDQNWYYFGNTPVMSGA